METSAKTTNSIPTPESPLNFEQLAIKLILENPKLRELREEVMEKGLELDLRNVKLKLKELKKGEMEECEKELKKESF